MNFRRKFIGASCTGLVCVVISCEHNQDATKKSESSSDVAVVVVRNDGITMEQFDERFCGILSEKRLMESEVADRIEMLCREMSMQTLEFMLRKAAGDVPAGISEGSWQFGFNQLMVGASQRFGAESAASLYKLSINEVAPDVMRDYASQHYVRTEARELRTLLVTDIEACESRVKKMLDSLDVLVEKVEDNSSVLPGTVLLGVAALAMEFQHNPELFSQISLKVERLAMPILENPRNYNSPTRSAAIQSAARLGAVKAGPIILKMAMSGGTPMPDRISAIGALKYYPELLTSESLNQMPASERQIKFAKQQLLESIQIPK